MMFVHFAVEAAVVEKFFIEETASQFEDMLPNPDGTLKPFAIEQIIDPICSIQRHLDLEVILLAW